MKEFFDVLMKDHDEVKDLFEKLMESSPGAEKTREKLFSQLEKELVPHLKAEEIAFYPFLMENKETKIMALEAVEEHALTELVLNQMKKLSVKNDVWTAKLKVLKDMVEHHIEEEEEELFEAAEEALEENAFKQVMQSFQKEKEKIKAELK